jgi:hypothetical protein
MTDLLRKLLTLREAIRDVATAAADYGVSESLPELAKMEACWVEAWKKVTLWDLS